LHAAPVVYLPRDRVCVVLTLRCRLVGQALRQSVAPAVSPVSMQHVIARRAVQPRKSRVRHTLAVLPGAGEDLSDDIVGLVRPDPPQRVLQNGAVVSGEQRLEPIAVARS
jgi:hypothetical protein